jgi:diaminopimelate decarboxylase
LGRAAGQRALRFNPDVAANTHPYIATGHGGAKFGLTAEVIQNILANQSAYPNLDFAGIHIHIGSQLHDTAATKQAINAALRLIAPYPNIRAVNIGGGLPVAYSPDDVMPPIEDFAATLKPLLQDYTVLLEPGRSIVADAGILITQILYVKQQAGQTFYIVDASMSELIRPALYQAKHAVVAVKCDQTDQHNAITVVGPVCETADVLGSNIDLPQMNPGDLLAILDTGAYGMAMSSNYNARPRPAEIVVSADGDSWRIARPRETWNDLIRGEST